MFFLVSPVACSPQCVNSLCHYPDNRFCVTILATQIFVSSILYVLVSVSLLSLLVLAVVVVVVVAVDVVEVL